MLHETVKLFAALQFTRSMGYAGTDLILSVDGTFSLHSITYHVTIMLTC